MKSIIDEVGNEFVFNPAKIEDCFVIRGYKRGAQVRTNDKETIHNPNVIQIIYGGTLVELYWDKPEDRDKVFKKLVGKITPLIPVKKK